MIASHLTCECTHARWAYFDDLSSTTTAQAYGMNCSTCNRPLSSSNNDGSIDVSCDPGYVEEFYTKSDWYGIVWPLIPKKKMCRASKYKPQFVRMGGYFVTRR